MAKNEFGATLWTGLKLIFVNLVASIFTALVYVFLLLLGISFQNPAIGFLLFIIYIVSIILIGGAIARSIGWE